MRMQALPESFRSGFSSLPTSAECGTEQITNRLQRGCENVEAFSQPFLFICGRYAAKESNGDEGMAGQAATK